MRVEEIEVELMRRLEELRGLKGRLMELEGEEQKAFR